MSGNGTPHYMYMYIVSPLTWLVVDSATRVVVSGVAVVVMARGGMGGFKSRLQKSVSLQHNVVARSASQPGLKHFANVKLGWVISGTARHPYVVIRSAWRLTKHTSPSVQVT